VTRVAPGWIGPGLLALFLLPAVAYAGYSVTDRWYQGYLLGLEEQDLRREIEELREANLRLQADVSLARSHAQIEKIEREHLNLVRPGDRPILLVGPPAAQPDEVAGQRQARSVPERPAWRRLLDAIFKRQST
jgi:cell division protein FtsB